MRIEPGLFYIDIVLVEWEYEPGSMYNQEINAVAVGDRAWQDRVDSSFIIVPLSAGDYPYPGTFLDSFKKSETCILPVNIEDIADDTLVYLTRGMMVKIAHPVIKIRVPHSPLQIGNFEVEVAPGEFRGEYPNRPDDKHYTYTVPAIIAKASVRAAYYVSPEDGLDPSNIRQTREMQQERRAWDSGWMFETVSLETISDIIRRKNK